MECRRATGNPVGGLVTGGSEPAAEPLMTKIGVAVSRAMNRRRGFVRTGGHRGGAPGEEGGFAESAKPRAEVGTYGMVTRVWPIFTSNAPGDLFGNQIFLRKVYVSKTFFLRMLRFAVIRLTFDAAISGLTPSGWPQVNGPAPIVARRAAVRSDRARRPKNRRPLISRTENSTGATGGRWTGTTMINPTARWPAPSAPASKGSATVLGSSPPDS